MRRTFTSAAFMMLPIGCANASNPTFDSSNSVHCLVIFGVAANGAKQVSNTALANAMVGRAAFLGEQNGGSEWVNKVTPQAIQIGTKMEAVNDEKATLKLLDECVANQNADPAFQSRFSKR